MFFFQLLMFNNIYKIFDLESDYYPSNKKSPLRDNSTSADPTYKKRLTHYSIKSTIIVIYNQQDKFCHRKQLHLHKTQTTFFVIQVIDPM